MDLLDNIMEKERQNMKLVVVEVKFDEIRVVEVDLKLLKL